MEGIQKMKIQEHLFKIAMALILIMSFLLGCLLGFETSQKTSDTILEEPVYKLLDRIYDLEE